MAAMSQPEPVLAKTPLYDLHVAAGAKIVPFAGYQMPLQYQGILAEHEQCRTRAALFDVSHMGQIRFTGEGLPAFFERLSPSDILSLASHHMRYTVMCHDKGGIIDDIMILHRGEDILVVVNAACRAKDWAHIQQHLPRSIKAEFLETQGLLALQGPDAKTVMARLAPDVLSLSFMQGMWASINGIQCYVTRSGYTGEDGFEVSVAAEDASTLAQTLLQEQEVAWAGLGARDTLRLEAGLCLYGHDMNDATTPIEASLGWVMGKRRKTEGGFIGDSEILRQLRDGAPQKRLGFRVDGNRAVREGMTLENEAGASVGHITSGSLAPTLGYPVAMGYVHADHVSNTTFYVTIRGQRILLTKVAMPFRPAQYVK